MITALALLGYAACAAWCVPALLAPLTRRGVSVRAGLAAWLAAMASVLASAAVAIELSFRTVAADWPQLTQALCRSVAGGACTPAVYRSALYEGGVTALAVTATLLAAAAAWRYARRVQRSRAQTRSHARTALLVGRAIAGPAADAASPPADAAAGLAAIPAKHDGRARAVVLDDPRPAAYCAAGRPAAIVVTSGALAVLDPPQLRAVLAHESAHLAHGHHALATVTRGLAAAFPGVPLFARGAAEVARLAEMSADDTAVRTSGSRPWSPPLSRSPPARRSRARASLARRFPGAPWQRPPARSLTGSSACSAPRARLGRPPTPRRWPSSSPCWPPPRPR